MRSSIDERQLQIDAYYMHLLASDTPVSVLTKRSLIVASEPTAHQIVLVSSSTYAPEHQQSNGGAPWRVGIAATLTYT